MILQKIGILPSNCLSNPDTLDYSRYFLLWKTDLKFVDLEEKLVLG